MSSEFSLSLQKLFSDAIKNRKIELCNNLMKCGAVVNEEIIISCLTHATPNILSQLWEMWENKPTDNSKFIEIAKFAIDYLDKIADVDQENRRIVGHIQFLIEKINNPNDKRLVVTDLIIYISQKLDINTHAQLLILLLGYMPQINQVDQQLIDIVDLIQMPIAELFSPPPEAKYDNQIYHNYVGDLSDVFSKQTQSYGCSHC